MSLLEIFKVGQVLMPTRSLLVFLQVDKIDEGDGGPVHFNLHSLSEGQTGDDLPLIRANRLNRQARAALDDHHFLQGRMRLHLR